MKNDLELVVHKLSTGLQEIRIYPLGDLHIGSPDFNIQLFDAWLKKVSEDDYARVVILGDMLDNGLKNSKTNVYDAPIRPREQKEWLKNKLYPIKDKILVAVPGNHERRSSRETDDCPLYDVMCKLDIEDLYRENIAFVKVNLGAKRANRQYSYTFVVSHGGSDNKVKAFGATIDGMDMMFSGHTHQPKDFFPAKFVIDTKNECVTKQPYFHIIVPSMCHGVGYPLMNLYTPQSNIHPTVTLSGTSKNIKVEREWHYGY